MSAQVLEYPILTHTMPQIRYSLNGSGPKTLGIDYSRYQPIIDYQQLEADGVKFAIGRCTVGDYYSDTDFVKNWNGFGLTNILRSAYLVVAPAWSAEFNYRPVSAQAHFDNFMRTFEGRIPDLPIVLDCELTRNQTPGTISDLIDDLIWMIEGQFDRLPIIYTRGNWWNENTVPRTSFGLCDLWIARYTTTLTHPWEDNLQYKPRDWDAWTFWQYSEEGTLPGIPTSHVDLDHFNGSLEDLLCYAEDEPVIDPPPIPEPESEILYMAEVVNCTKLNIRERPWYPAGDALDMGDLRVGSVIAVLEEVEQHGNIWVRFGGSNLWAARTYAGYTYLKIVD